jgi:hypothetical protein
MGHWYPWATPEFILHRMTFGQFLLYYRHIPPEGRLKIKSTGDKPDRRALHRLTGGRKVFNR